MQLQHAGAEVAGLPDAQAREADVAQVGAAGGILRVRVIRDFNRIMRCAQNIDPNVFYITENPGQVSRFRKTLIGPLTGWRAVLKRK